MTSAGAVPTVLPTRFFGVTMPDPRQREHFHRVRHRVVAVRHNHKAQAALALVRLGLRLRLGVEHVGVVAERDVHRPALQGVQLSPGGGVVGDTDFEAGLAEEPLLQTR